MDLYTRTLKHIDMNRVKELREEKIKKRKLAEMAKQQEIILAEMKRIEVLEDPRYSNWKRDLEEGMTTSALGMINLQPNIPGPEDDKTRDVDPSLTPDGTLDSNGVWTMNNAPDAGNAGISITLLLDLSRSNTFSTQVYFDNATIDPTHGMDVVFDGPVGSGLQHIVPLSVPGSGTGDANPQITIPPKFRIKDVMVTYTVIGDGGDPGAREIGNNAITISSAVPYRSSPMNVFVSLDDPESLPFHRGGLGGSEEKRKELQDMLEAGNEWMAINGLEPSQTSPGDMQIANAGPSTPVKTDSDGRIVPNQGGGRPGKVRLKPFMLPRA